MIVMKFGGTSVGSTDGIRKVVELIRQSQGRDPFVVVSAMSGVTDLLLASARTAMARNSSTKQVIADIEARHIEVINQLGLDENLISPEIVELGHVLFGISLVKELTARTLDYVGSFGERMSSKIVTACARKSGIKAQAYNSYDLGLITDENFGEAEILPTTYAAIVSAVKEIPAGIIPVVTGFVGKTEAGEVTTLGRGGSDYSASIFGSALNAEEIQIWTDVDGIMTTDPRIVPGATSVDIVSFEEASELAYFGAKVLHPKTIVPAMNKMLPVRVHNTFNPSLKRTLILKNASKKQDVTAITSKENIYVIKINSARMLLAYGFLKHVFNLFAEFKVPVDLIATSEVNVSVTVDNKYDISQLVERLKEFANVDVLSDRASISIVGNGVKFTPGISGKIASILGKSGINIEMTSQSYADVNMTIVVMKKHNDEAVRALHDEFFGADARAPVAVAAKSKSKLRGEA